MKTIWKYTIIPKHFKHNIPSGGKVLSVGEQFGEICIWVEVDPENQTEEREFKAYGTGHPIFDATEFKREFLGTVMLEGGALIFHVYEYITKPEGRSPNLGLSASNS